ncbi:hypothetical protein B0T22DRAFT_100446 [Podospora appendiculata]|uniref:Uncharacterized protein n=1 Tax=Podospora appendiculata TaxID=314037 RepID=A0AAE0XKW6_9PEZI|nr:hypothetical protein B0T22DRAFT_100446 [Podospora appendiculata]
MPGQCLEYGCPRGRLVGIYLSLGFLLAGWRWGACQALTCQTASHGLPSVTPRQRVKPHTPGSFASILPSPHR